MAIPASLDYEALSLLLRGVPRTVLLASAQSSSAISNALANNY